MPNQYTDRPPRPLIFLPGHPHIALVELTKDQFAVIDKEDADRVGRHNWRARWDAKSRSFYAVTDIRDSGGAVNYVPLHQLLMGNAHGLTVDHIESSNTLDNRRCNMRHASRSLQNINRSVPRNNTTGYKNVLKAGQKWRVMGRGITQKRIHIGYFSTIEEAIEAAKSPLLMTNLPQGTHTP